MGTGEDHSEGLESMAMLYSQDGLEEKGIYGTIVSSRFTPLAQFASNHPRLADSLWDRFNLVADGREEFGYIYDCRVMGEDSLEYFPGEKRDIGPWPEMRVPYTHIGRSALAYLAECRRQEEEEMREHFANLSDEQVGNLLLLLNSLDGESRERARAGAHYVTERIFEGAGFLPEIHEYIDLSCEGAPVGVRAAYFGELVSAALENEPREREWKKVRRFLEEVS